MDFRRRNDSSVAFVGDDITRIRTEKASSLQELVFRGAMLCLTSFLNCQTVTGHSYGENGSWVPLAKAGEKLTF